MRARAVCWNVERFFGLRGSPVARSLSATAADGWDREAYASKLRAVSAVLRACSPGGPPALIGLCEVEDNDVLADIVAATGWTGLRSVDPPTLDPALDGFDVGILHDPARLQLVGEPVSHNIHNRFATRDILEARFRTPSGAEMVVLMNHWPSRTIGGSEPLRIGLADYTARLMTDAVRFRKAPLISPAGRVSMPPLRELERRWNTPVLVMGDFNDEPYDTSVRTVMGTHDRPEPVARKMTLATGRGKKRLAHYLSRRPRLYNPSWLLVSPPTGPQGTYHRRANWHVYDQVLFSRGFLVGRTPRYVDGSLHVFGETTVPSDSGSPVRVRSSSGAPKSFSVRTGRGVSDHLPLVFELDL